MIMSPPDDGKTADLLRFHEDRFCRPEGLASPQTGRVEGRWQGDREGGPPTRPCTGRGEGAAVRLDQGTGDRQPQAAFRRPGGLAVEPVE